MNELNYFMTGLKCNTSECFSNISVWISNINVWISFINATIYFLKIRKCGVDKWNGNRHESKFVMREPECNIIAHQCSIGEWFPFMSECLSNISVWISNINVWISLINATISFLKMEKCGVDERKCKQTGDLISISRQPLYFLET